MRRLLTASEVAELLGLSARHVYANATELGVVRFGRAVRFDPAAVERYIDRHTVQPEPPMNVCMTGRRSPRAAASRRPILPPRTDLLPREFGS